jgi:hypothetical protein
LGGGITDRCILYVEFLYFNYFFVFFFHLIFPFVV